MIYVIYLILAVLTVLLSVKCADYVDNIDKKTNVSGAFIGGVVLAAITSLPELITSLSATILLKSADYVVGNILGSNIFNLTIIGAIILFSSKSFCKANIGKSHLTTCLMSLGMYAAVSFPILFKMDSMFFTVSVVSLIILVLYLLSVRSLASDSAESAEENGDCALSVKQLIIRFIIAASGLVIASVLITYTTDVIAGKLKLGTTLAGALFLGIATSLPELSSSIALAKRKNFNALTGNILGSNCFNFIIFLAADISFFKGSVYAGATQLAQRQATLLIIFGVLSTLCSALVLFLRRKAVLKRTPYIISASAILISYLLFLILSV